MQPVDFRNVTFASLQGMLRGMRLAVLTHLRTHGAGTTRQIAARSGISILTVRPRVTELMEMGFVKCVDGTENAKEGIYRAATDAEAADFLRAKQATYTLTQPELAIV